MRALAANTALVDSFRLSDVLIRAHDEGLSGEALKKAVAVYNEDLIARGKTSIQASNSVLQKYEGTTNFVTFGIQAKPIPLKEVVLSEVEVLG